LSASHYERLGGLTGSIEAAVKEAFARPEEHPIIPDDTLAQNRLLESVFVPALVDINEANNEPVRRIATEAEIPDVGGGVITRLVDARLLVRNSRSALDGNLQTTIEVAHEALLRQWSALRRILDSRSADRKVIQSCDVWVSTDGLVYSSDFNGGLFILEYEG